MLRAEGQQAAQRFVEDMREVLEKCTKDTEDLKRSFAKGPLGTGSEAIAFSATIKSEMEQLQCRFPVLDKYSKEAPRANKMLCAAFANLKAITDVFDRFEDRIESAYGIAPVVVPVKAEEPKKVEVLQHSPGQPVHQLQSASNCPTQPSTSDSAFVSLTPRPSARNPDKEVELPMPKTPGLEDFGISNEDLRGLGMSVGSSSGSKGQTKWHPATSSTSIPTSRSTDQQDLLASSRLHFQNRDPAELAQTSISDLGIETPVQVADKFESRRHRALATMMITTTPRLKSGGVERTMDYTGLAGGYYGASAMKSETQQETHRQLNFDETPMRRPVEGKEVMQLRQHIAASFDSLGFWCSKISCECLQEAAVFLQEQGDRVFEKSELSDILSERMPGQSYYSIIASLSKLKVLEMDKRQGEEAIYRVAGWIYKR